MRNTMVAIITTLFLVVTVSQVAATSGYVPGQTTEAYAYTHGGYVGKATVKVRVKQRAILPPNQRPRLTLLT